MAKEERGRIRKTADRRNGKSATADVKKFMAWLEKIIKEKHINTKVHEEGCLPSSA